MKTISVSRILVFCVLLPLASHAQSEPRHPKGERPSLQAIWGKYDADGDGFLSFEEFQSMPRIARLPDDKQLQLFSRLDKDADGKISQKELREMRHPRDDTRPARGMRRLMELDTNGSGGVCLEEFRTAEMVANLPPERIEALFRRLDTDGDGEITPKDRPELPPTMRAPQGPRGERPHLHRRLFNQLDTDGSGSLTFDQFRKARSIEAMDEDAQEKLFLRLDADGNQRLTFEEFSKIPLTMLAPLSGGDGENRRHGRPGHDGKSPQE